MSLIRHNDLVVWEPFSDAVTVGIASGTLLASWNVPPDEHWEVTSGGIRVDVLGGGISYLAWSADNTGRRLNSTAGIYAVAGQMVWPLNQVVWVPGGRTMTAFAAGATDARIVVTITGRKWYF